MIRTIVHRLKRLETQVRTASVPPHSHVLYFVDVNHRVVSTLEMATGKWTHFDTTDRPVWESGQ